MGRVRDGGHRGKEQFALVSTALVSSLFSGGAGTTHDAIENTFNVFDLST